MVKMEKELNYGIYLVYKNQKKYRMAWAKENRWNVETERVRELERLKKQDGHNINYDN